VKIDPSINSTFVAIEHRGRAKYEFEIEAQFQPSISATNNSFQELTTYQVII